MITQEIVAEKLLWPLWRCITDDYKGTYKKDCWEHFENAIKSASYTGSLKVFLTNFQKRIPVDLQAQYTKDILSIVEAKEDEQVLDWLRTEATYMVMIIRLKSQDKREAWKEAHEQETIGKKTINNDGEVIEKSFKRGSK